ncbi:putative ABC transport system ATP-binding protein [Nocardioides terrae]|uniref:Putative ABC transport system ATP-binding protein n=1 Tax=Nocardioides terrae TaxID=574651 RepID=A0A1I1DXR2_9ACTN|nr:ATP-binding cassette domain-containing protein [Nocardioides terrae]SFB79614.1 putative ABC transport system ATP-binding protein [Nocardioides terrae]
MTELVATDLSVEYAGQHGPLCAVRPLDLELAAGTFLAVTGPSGAGKSSLLWALAGALTPATGTVTVTGERVTDRERAATLGIALIPQGNGLAGSLSAEENILVPLVTRRVDPAEAFRRTDDALELVGLADSRRHLVDELSGGQQQRVALARALAQQPRVILADESTSDLDAGNRARMIGALRREAQRGAVVVLATHDPEAAAEADAELALDQSVATWARPLPG